MENIIRNTNGIPDTHYFIYRDKKYPIKFDFFKYSSKYFQVNQETIQQSQDIQLIIDDCENHIKLTDDIIQTFINYVQCNDIQLNNENVVGLNYLSTQYEVPTLIKYTNEYINNHHTELVLDILFQTQTQTNNDSSKYEEIISAHLSDYLDDERLLNLSIPTLYRIIQKYPKKKNDKKLNDFLFKALSKFGKKASLLFSDVDFGDSRSFYVNRLLNDFSSSFDFHFINSSLVQTLYENQSEFQRREELHKIENEKLIKRIELLENKQKNFEDEIQKEKVEVRKIISDLRDELKKEIQKNKNKEEERVKSYNQLNKNNEKINAEINEIKENISKLKIKMDDNDKNYSQKVDEIVKQNQNINAVLESKKEEIKNVNMRIQHLKPSIPLLHKENDDFNGIIKYLTEKTGGNIHDNKTIEVSSNSVLSSSKHPKNLLDFNCATCYEANSKNDSWICFDFKQMKIKLTNYSIKSHNDSLNSHHLKSWTLEASNNGETWTTIDEHKDCQTLNGMAVTGTFEANSNDFSRYVRLHQTDTPWGGHDLWFHYIEFYGYLQE